MRGCNDHSSSSRGDLARSYCSLIKGRPEDPYDSFCDNEGIEGNRWVNPALCAEFVSVFGKEGEIFYSPLMLSPSMEWYLLT